MSARLRNRPVVTALGARSRIYAHLHEQSWTLVAANPPDYEEMMCWKRILQPGAIFVDVGANAGMYALWALDLGCEVIAVEPSPEMVLRINANLALNGYSADVIEAALAASRGRLRLKGEDFRRNRLVFDSETDGIEVEVRCLDDVIGGRVVDGVKIDVEGAERLVLEGGRVALSEGRLRVIQLEWNRCSEQLLGEDREPVAILLREHGYRLGRPQPDGTFQTLDSPSFGADVFALAPDVTVPA